MERPYRPLIEESFFRRILRTVSRFVFYPILFAAFAPIYQFKVENRKRLRGPAVSVMNHCIYVEWFFLWHAVRPRYIRFTAEQENMQNQAWAWFNWLLGVIGIPRNNPMGVAPAVAASLERGELIHFFPEGVIKDKSQDPGIFHIGAAWFACRHNVPLIPVAEILLPRKPGTPFSGLPPKVLLIVGEPMDPAAWARDGEKLRATADRMTAEAEKWIRATINHYK